MKIRSAIWHASVVLLCAMTTSAGAIQLQPVVTSGISNPVFVGPAGDGSNRLFIVERRGVIRVFQPASQTLSMFLDIHTKLTSAGAEQGLLGLAFHPQYPSNGRFFVYYTRAPDGALVISEFRVSADSNVAGTAETVLLTIPHPVNTNHNGGMLAFGPDGYLYVGVGDGGSANDPPNNAQNLQVLLGKILRIDIDQPDLAGGKPYSSPADNPFVDGSGRPEIFTYGMRNPWRFSFDRETGQMWVGDVGQGAREEVDTPMIAGGNYGWRPYEGMACSNNDPALCNPASFIFPVLEYGHTEGRCSITGGYVYRGTSGTLPVGTYLYGDYCTGEIFAWSGNSQEVLLDTAFHIASFGQDEQGELYVVDSVGTISKIVEPRDTAAVFAIEYYHPAFDHYFSTASLDEIAKLDSGVFQGWVRTGDSIRVVPTGSMTADPVCRFLTTVFAPKSSHFYTLNREECDAVKVNPRWEFEGHVFNLREPRTDGDCGGWLPVYRLYNAGLGGAPNHRYTTKLEVRAAMLSRGWIAEGFGVGVAMCSPPN